MKFIYGFHPQNMKLLRRAGYGVTPRLLVRTPEETLLGRDIVGVSCLYRDVWHGRYCLLENSAELPFDTNATCHLVAAGVAASVLALSRTKARPGVYLTHELGGWMRAFRSLVEVHEYRTGRVEPA